MRQDYQAWFDFETTGLTLDYSPIQIAILAVVNGKIVDKFHHHLRISPLLVDIEALRINKVDLLQEGIKTQQEFKNKYYDFMNKNFFTENGKIIRATKETLPLFCGHNTAFDRPFLRKLLGSDWDMNYYHEICTMRFASALQAAGSLSTVENLKLETLCAYFDVPKPDRFHDALCDIEQTFVLWQEMKKLII